MLSKEAKTRSSHMVAEPKRSLNALYVAPASAIGVTLQAEVRRKAWTAILQVLFCAPSDSVVSLQGRFCGHAVALAAAPPVYVPVSPFASFCSVGSVRPWPAV